MCSGACCCSKSGLARAPVRLQDAWETGVKHKMRVFNSQQEVRTLCQPACLPFTCLCQPHAAPLSATVCRCCVPYVPQVGYFHSYQDGVDFVFVDHPSYHAFGSEWPACLPCRQPSASRSARLHRPPPFSCARGGSGPPHPPVVSGCVVRACVRE